MASTEHIPCPDCGFLMHPLDNACPRCAKLRAEGKTPTPQIPLPPASNAGMAGPPPAPYRPAPGSAQLQAVSRDRYQQPKVPTVAIVLCVFIGLGASTTWMNKATFAYPPFLFYSILHVLAAAAVIYGLCKIEPWARAATFTFLIVNLLVGVPITGKAIIESSRQVDAQVEAQMESNGVRIEHGTPGTTTFTPTITPGTPPPGSTPPPTPGMPPTTTTPMPTPTSSPGPMTITTHGMPSGMGFFGGMAALFGLIILGIVAFFRLILDIIFIVLLSSREVRELYA